MQPNSKLPGIGLIVILLMGLDGLASVQGEPLSPSARREYQDLLRADVILRGTVLSVAEEYVRAGELEPKWQGGGYGVVSVVDFAVEEVIWGALYAEGTCTFLVDMSNSELRANYTTGQQMVVSLMFRSRFRGGAYFASANEARFVFDGDSWLRQGHITGQHSISLEEIRAIVAPSHIEVVEESSDIVVIGVVTKVDENLLEDPSGGGVARVWIVSMTVSEILKGADVPDPLTFKMFAGGTYWPSWADVGPNRVEKDTLYCAFIRKIEGDFYSAGGLNGFFRTKDNVLIRNEVTLPVTIDRVRALGAE